MRWPGKGATGCVANRQISWQGDWRGTQAWRRPLQKLPYTKILPHCTRKKSHTRICCLPHHTFLTDTSSQELMLPTVWDSHTRSGDYTLLRRVGSWSPCCRATILRWSSHTLGCPWACTSLERCGLERQEAMSRSVTRASFTSEMLKDTALNSYGAVGYSTIRQKVS